MKNLKKLEDLKKADKKTLINELMQKSLKGGSCQFKKLIP